MLNAASAGTIAFKRDSKFTGCVVSSGDTTLGSVALVCGIGLYRSLEVASTSGCWCVSSTCLGSVLLVLLVLLLVFSLVVVVCCTLLSLAVVFSLLAVFSARSASSPGCVFFLPLAFWLCSTWSSLSPLAVALLLVSGFSFQSLLVYLSLVFARLFSLSFLHARRPWSISATFTISLASLTFLLIVLLWYILATLSAHLGHEYLVSVSPPHHSVA